MPPESNAVVPAATLVKDYVVSLPVTTPEGRKLEVPVNAEANRLKSQVMAADLRSFITEQVEMYRKTKKQLKPLDIKALVDSFSKVEDVARFAYAPGLAPGAGGESGATQAEKMVRAMAEGMTTAQIKSNPEDRMNRMKSLGKPNGNHAAAIIELD